MKKSNSTGWVEVGIVLVAVWLAGCSPRNLPLDRASLTMLNQATVQPGARGELIYRGEVFELDAAPSTPSLYRYERRVSQSGKTLVSTHLTLTPSTAGNSAVVLQTAKHDANYRLSEFTEIQGQAGRRGHLLVRSDGRLEFESLSGGVTTRKTEAAPDDLKLPVVVGPTLFGYVLAHWPALQRGDVLSVRFADLVSLSSYEFSLTLETQDSKTTVIKFAPASWLVRLALDDMFLHFDSKSGKIVRYEGRVPPFLIKEQSQSALDARVEYQFVAKQYL